MKKAFVFFLFVLLCYSKSSFAALGDVISSFPSPGGAGIGSRGLAWDGQYLWNSNCADSTIYKINPLNGNVVNSFTAPNLNSGDLTFVGNEIWNVDLFTRTIYSGNTITGAPWTVEFTKPGNDYIGLAYDGSGFWASDFNTYTIDKLDLSGNVLASYPSPSGCPSGLAWDGTYLWNTDCFTDMIYKIDPSNGNVIASFSAPSGDTTGLTFDGQHLWVADFLTNNIYELDLGYTPAPPGVITLISMLGGLGGWAGSARILRHRKKEPKKNKAA